MMRAGTASPSPAAEARAPAAAAHPARPDAALRTAFERCAEIVRARARNFYYGLRLTPEPRRSAIYSVYAWMRWADDETDASADPATKRSRLAAFSRDTIGALDRGADPTRDPVLAAFADTVHRYGIEGSEVRAMLEALAHDLDKEQPCAGSGSGPAPMFATREELQRYCYGVASIVGVVCVRIWGLRPGAEWDAARRLAERRGLAFQLTNILRDLGRDYDSGRLYIAAEDFERAGLTPQRLRAWEDDERCTRLVRAVASWARRCYEDSGPLDGMICAECVPAMWAMTRIYSGILAIVEQDPRRVVQDRRIRLSSGRKAAIALRAVMRSKAR